MKNVFVIMVSSMILYSCANEELLSIDGVDVLNAELKSVVDEYEMNLKDEQTPTTEIEAFADIEIRKAIQDSISLLNNTYSISKTKTYADLNRSFPSSIKVGVFKIASCGSHPEFVYYMDCEDGGWSNTEGTVGATIADGNNIKFHFCLVPGADYNGGTLLLTTYGWDPILGDVDIVERYHDNEDTRNKNDILVNGLGSIHMTNIGHCSFTENTRFTWIFTEKKNGTLPFQYGVLTNDFSTEDGKINIDDQNRGNSNYAKLWRHKSADATIVERNMENKERFRGITHSENTIYHIKINNN